MYLISLSVFFFSIDFKATCVLLMIIPLDCARPGKKQTKRSFRIQFEFLSIINDFCFFFFVVEYSFLQHCTYNQPNTETAKHQTHNKKKTSTRSYSSGLAAQYHHGKNLVVSGFFFKLH